MSDQNSETVAAPVSLPPPFPVERYKRDGGATIAGLMMLVGALAITGAVLGYAVHWIARYVYLIVIFPVLIGVAMGAIGGRMVTLGRIRNAWLAGFAGFVGGVLAMFMSHYFDQQQFRREVLRTDVLSQLMELTPDKRAQVLVLLPPGVRAQAERDLRAADSVLGYLDREAYYGVRIGDVGGTSEVGTRPLNLGYVGSYLYWIIETLIVAIITYFMVLEPTKVPYCVNCERWKSGNVLGFFTDPPGDVAAAVESGDLARIQRSNPTQDITDLRLSAHACDTCMEAGDADLKLEFFTIDEHGQSKAKIVAHVTYPATVLPYLLMIFKQAPSTVGEPTK